MAERQVGGADVNVDIAPVLIGERQTDNVTLKLDVTVPLGVQYGGLDVMLDIVPPFDMLRQTASLGLMVDYVASVGPPLGSVFWSAASGRFELTGTDVVMWNPADRFEISGSYPIVTWVSDHFEEAP